MGSKPKDEPLEVLAELEQELRGNINRLFTVARPQRMKTVKEIVADHLRQGGFDGLHYDGECGCELDDLMPCLGEFGGDISHCAPGYKTPCDPGTCELGGDCPWHIGKKDPSVCDSCQETDHGYDK